MHKQAMRYVRLLTIVAFVGLLTTSSIFGAEKIGKLFIKADRPDTGGQTYADPDLENAAKSVTTQAQKRSGQFDVVMQEADADFLLVVTKRESQPVSGQPDEIRIQATFSLRDGASWKLGTKLDHHAMGQRLAADGLVDDARDWVKLNGLSVKKSPSH